MMKQGAAAAGPEIHTSKFEQQERERQDQELRLPVVEEQPVVTRRQVKTAKVRLNKVVDEREEIIEEPLIREEINVERVPVNRFVPDPVPPRYEGETLIISLFEEVLVVEKRLLLKEELRVSKRQVAVPTRQAVTLRSERLDVERVTASAPAEQQPSR